MRKMNEQEGFPEVVPNLFEKYPPGSTIHVEDLNISQMKHIVEELTLRSIAYNILEDPALYKGFKQAIKKIS